ncbi:VPLPA-CTERM sorting domain-containing protein [Tabrizicola sp. J26]|uniref:VPLPA-CTERM sorting domain-containing protein n=1 Tax=Alitabrizicola rongguiensis TaxID=2909234 RepID=UPI001F281413|nr:VPLPA-CTERM sorting domain-containing protein [Tabrizicola rongguiensis]MCF1709899.1 VPLPA-CTERM sorting domain-containing protein [Tabrizicola rongguiensis]
MFKILCTTTALALFAIPASAATMKAVYSGKVNYGYDMTGVFGTAGADLSGLDYVLTYVYDTSKGYRWTSGGYDQVYGGEWYGKESPVLSATLKINGHSTEFGADSYGSSYAYSDQSSYSYRYDYAYDYSYDDTHYAYDYIYSYGGFSQGSSGNLEDLATLTEAAYGYSYFEKYVYDYSDWSASSYVYGSLALSKLSVSEYEPAAVPLPASALMLVAGFGGLGALRVMRRRAA